MSLDVCILASGSGGNAAVLRAPGGVMLIDAGIGPRTTARRLDGTGVGVEDIRAICLTHLDSDHFRWSWLRTIIRQGIRVCCHHTRADELLGMADAQLEDGRAALKPLLYCFDGQEFQPIAGLGFRPIALAHDAWGSHGFVVEGHGCRLGYATDLGRVPDDLLACFERLDLLALESNYDPQMQLASARPAFLKDRIMGGRGHLSNQQAYDAVCRILDRCERDGSALPGYIVLLHRSRECNCPKLLRKLFATDGRIARRLLLAEQHARTPWLRVRGGVALSGEQLGFGWEP